MSNSELSGKGKLISLSVDLCGSTEIKGRIISLTKGQEDRRSELYGRYLDVLFHTESTFYEMLSRDERIDLRKLFLVKSIGDEFWYVYEVDPDADCGYELKRAAAALMDAVFATFSKTRHMQFWSRHIQDFEEVVDAELVQYDPPLKAVMDLFDDAVELNMERQKKVGNTLIKIAQGASDGIVERNTMIAEMFNRLNIAATTLSANQQKAITAIRTDYVGLEVDRFFRIAKFSRPNILSIGKNLYESIGARVDDIEEFENLALKHFSQQVPDASGMKASFRNVIVEDVPRHQMKGVSEDYMLYHLFELSSLAANAFRPIPNLQDLMKPTRSFFGESGVYAVPRSKLR